MEVQMQIETEQDEQRKIEDEIVDQWNYEEAEAILDWANPSEEQIYLNNAKKKLLGG